MRKGSLFFRIYLGCVIAYLAVGVATIVFLWESRPSKEVSYVSRLAVKDLVAQRNDPQSLAAELSWLRQYPLKISVYDGDGSLLASTVAPPLPMVNAAIMSRLQATGEVQLDVTHTVYAERKQGRLVAVGVLHWDASLNGLYRLAAVRFLGSLLFFLVFAALFARYLVKPLQQLTSTAHRFGRGELGARARLTRNDEIGEVGRAFDEMADRVKRLIAAQQELMANVSHELQTPLARIHVALELIAVQGLEKATEHLPEIEMDLAELQRLFDDVMMVARLDLSRSHDQAVRTPLRIETISVERLLHKVASRFRAEHQSHDFILDVQPGLPELPADNVLLRRVIENLTENARKYSEPGSTIRVAAAASSQAVTIEVADNGIGIDDADLGQVFTPFFRSDRSRARQTGGFGLGLALARRVMEAHGGTIEITSTLGQGTTAVLKLPTATKK